MKFKQFENIPSREFPALTEGRGATLPSEDILQAATKHASESLLIEPQNSISNCFGFYESRNPSGLQQYGDSPPPENFDKFHSLVSTDMEPDMIAAEYTPSSDQTPYNQNIIEFPSNFCNQTDLQRNQTQCAPQPPEQKSPTFLDQLASHAINHKLEEMRGLVESATFAAGRLALKGQITVFFAGPNVGKTLITLKLISEAIANETVGKHCFHINLDDTFEGLITKGDLGNRHNFKVLGPETFQNPTKNFNELVDKVLSENQANGTVLILDTVKKFTDVMDKRASSEFMTTCRKFTSAGGTIIALAHINKHKSADDSSIPAGTSDLLDDCDCAYVIDLISEKSTPEGIVRHVEFTNKKLRGPNTPNAVYQYTLPIDSDYYALFDSVKIIGGSEEDKLRQQKSLQRELEIDTDTIAEINAALGDDTVNQKTLIERIQSSAGHKSSRRSVISCLDRWSRPAEEGGLWKRTTGPCNANLYSRHK